jgi:predicted Zn-dependent peptidase
MRSMKNRASPLETLLWIVAVATLSFGAAGSSTATSNPKAKPASKANSTMPALAAPSIPIEEHLLGNGMKLILIPQHLAPTISGAWVAHVGSANEHPGITGISHLFEHMMFKGSHVIGTRDYAKDVRLIDEQEQVRDQMRAELSIARAAQRRGDLDDLAKPEAKTPRYRELEAKFDSLVTEQRANMVKNEFDNTLQKNGGTFMNAFTAEDMTVYFETLPANKLELWFWMEADRIQNRVFREFYSERDVVYEERRRSVESTPTGPMEEAFESMFWEASPYHWPVLGWPSDLPNITKAQADEYYSLYYAPQNLTALLVGDFDPKEALALAEKYLGAIPKGEKPAPEMITTEPPQLAEKRYYAEAETNPAVWMRWHTVAYVHHDVPALDVLEEILNGPTGRLKKSLVLGSGVATDASASDVARKYEGYFEIQGECKEGHTPEELEKAISDEVEKLQKGPVTDEELQKVKNRYLAGGYRQISSGMQLMFRYARAEGMGTWQDADRIDREVQALTAADIQRVANRYFQKENRTVAVWTRKGGTAEEDPALAGLSAEAKTTAKGMAARIAASNDPAQIQKMLERLDQMGGQVPPEMKPAIDYVRAKAQARLAELQSNK